MTTEKYYQHDVDCRELNGRIEAIQNDGKSTRIIMEPFSSLRAEVSLATQVQL